MCVAAGRKSCGFGTQPLDRTGILARRVFFFWFFSMLELGRGVRTGSHKHLPDADQTVHCFVHCAVVPRTAAAKVPGALAGGPESCRARGETTGSRG